MPEPELKWQVEVPLEEVPLQVGEGEPASTGAGEERTGEPSKGESSAPPPSTGGERPVLPASPESAEESCPPLPLEEGGEGGAGSFLAQYTPDNSSPLQGVEGGNKGSKERSSSVPPTPKSPTALFSPPAQAPAPPPLPRLLEAMLFATPQPLTAALALECIRGLTPEQFQHEIHALQQEYRSQGRPYGIQRQGDGYRLLIRSVFRFLLERLYGGLKEARLSPAVVETLSVVAYRQPVSKTDVDTLRGQDSGPMLRQLLRRGLIAVQGTTDRGKGEVLFVTPPRFLEFFQLASLDDLPRVDDLPYL